MIELQNVSLKFNRKFLLEDINLDIQKGDFVTLLGSNGAGKSTLLKVLGKSLSYHQGTINYQNISLKDWSAKEIAQHRAVLSQNIEFNFPAKIIEVVLMGRYPFCGNHAPTTKDVTIAYEALNEMGLALRAEQDISELSGGEKQRVQIARVMAQVWDCTPDNPKFLLLDEPTSNLDIAYQHQLLQLLQKKSKEKGLTTLAVLHDINLAAQYASKIALLKKGKLMDIGSPKEVLTQKAIKDTFGVSSIIHKHPIFDCIQISTY
jgi:iron complex transport system ATP-binding protein